MTETTTEMLTEQARFQQALDSIRAQGTKIRMNVQKCCRGCIEPKNLGLKDYDDPTPYGYVYGSQGSKVYWWAEKAYRKADSYADMNWSTGGIDTPQGYLLPYERVHINHGNGGAQVIYDAFVAAGFDVEWDGTDSQTVQIVLSRITEDDRCPY